MHLDDPYRIDGAGRTAFTEDRRRHIRNLIEAVLFTAPGERVNRPDFGAGLRELLFDANSEAMASATEFMVQSALQRHLGDVVAVEALEVTRHEGELRITLTYALIEDEERVSETFAREV
ncbi:MAG: GPW/gp25 family protein [Pseudomonadota bacterium]